jgi:small redox-active disulfide protein 2
VKLIQVFGPGCTKCEFTVKLIKDLAAEHGVEVAVEKVEDIARIAQAGIMSTPAVMLNGRVVHAGGIPKREVVVGWLEP